MAPDEEVSVSIVGKIEGLKAAISQSRALIKSFGLDFKMLAPDILNLKNLNKDFAALSKHKFKDASSFINEIQGMKTPKSSGFLPEDFDKKFKDASKYIDPLKLQRMPDTSALTKLPDPKKWGSGMKDANALIAEQADKINTLFGGMPDRFKATADASKVLTKGAKNMVLPSFSLNTISNKELSFISIVSCKTRNSSMHRSMPVTTPSTSYIFFSSVLCTTIIG